MQFQAKENIEHTLQQGLPNNQLAVFKNPESIHGLIWEEKNKEFHFGGTMYDVVRKERKNGNTLYYCINDKKESKIYNCLEDLVSKQLDNNNTTTGAANHYLIKLLVQVFILSGENNFAFTLFIEHLHYSHCYSFPYKVFSLEIVSPPPKMV